ncbi:neuronal acetylcholine receptor subunit beta-4-like [Babylonia areolata]|uniref:neuronal acetylcholine receptor subunit beta-4-like n=1 Tax=Babylonia areolata TaxID=304850 RepID=UPI003FCFA542
MSWTDRRLAWTIPAYNFTKVFVYPQKYLWTPDITISNVVQTMQPLGFDQNYLYVTYSGRIRWIVGGVYQTSCSIDVTFYPFDTQTCHIVFTTLVSSRYEISLVPGTPAPSSLLHYSPSGSWELLSFNLSSADQGQVFSSVTFELRLKRRTTYYVIAILVPVLFLSLTATLVFALPADSGEKMGTCITVLLAFAVYLTIVSDQMPKTSMNTSILSVYLSVLLGKTALGVVLSVWILNLHFRDDQRSPPGVTTRTIALSMQRLMRKGPRKDRVMPAEDPQDSAQGNAVSDSTCTLSSDLGPVHLKDEPTGNNGKPSTRYTPSSCKSQDLFSGPEMIADKELEGFLLTV